MLLFLLILIGLALAGTYRLKLDAGALAGIRVILCVLALLVALSRCRSLETTPEAEMTYDRHALIGWALGQELARDIPEGGPVVVMQMARASLGITRMADSEIEGLERGSSGVNFTWVFPSKTDDSEKEGDPSEMDRDEAVSFLDALDSAVAVVAFVPLPLGKLANRELPNVYLMDTYATGYWKPHLEKGVVTVAVAPDLSKAGVFDLKGSTQERFDLLFDLHRAGDAE